MKTKTSHLRRNSPFHPVHARGNFPGKFFVALAVVVVCFCALPVAGQEYQWFRQLSGTGVNNSVGNDVVTDASGNSYVVGKFGGTVNFGGSNTLVSHSPTGDIF